MRKICSKCNAEFVAQRMNVTKCCNCRKACLICGHRVKGGSTSGLCYSCDRSEDPNTELAALKRLEERQAKEAQHAVRDDGRPFRCRSLGETVLYSEPDSFSGLREECLTGRASARRQSWARCNSNLMR